MLKTFKIHQHALACTIFTDTIRAITLSPITGGQQNHTFSLPSQGKDEENDPLINAIAFLKQTNSKVFISAVIIISIREPQRDLCLLQYSHHKLWSRVKNSYYVGTILGPHGKSSQLLSYLRSWPWLSQLPSPWQPCRCCEEQVQEQGPGRGLWRGCC